MADPYSVNPLAQMLAERDPWRYDQLTRVGEPPKMFDNGTADVPAFTASGVDPSALLRLPFGVRHAAAEEPDITKVYAMFQQYIGIPEVEIDTHGLQDAKLRAEAWMRDTDPRTPEQIQADENQSEAEYDAYSRSVDRFGLTPDEHAILRRVSADERSARLAERQRHVEQASRLGQPLERPEWAEAEGAQA